MTNADAANSLRGTGLEIENGAGLKTPRVAFAERIFEVLSRDCDVLVCRFAGSRSVMRNVAYHRTSILRGMLAMLFAPALIVPPLALLMLALVDGNLDFRLGEAPTIFFIGYVQVARIAWGFGLPTWLVLRTMKRESGSNYMLAGALKACYG